MSKILKINLGIIVLGTVLFSMFDHFATSSGGYRGLTSMMLSCGLIIVQVGVNLILTIVSVFRKDGNLKYFLLSILLVLLIGVPLCIGGAYLASTPF